MKIPTSLFLLQEHIISPAGTKAWFGIRYGRSEYGIVDFSPDEASRNAHLNGAVAALLQKANELFETSPDIQKIEIVASKLPYQPPAEPNIKALLLTFKAKEGHEQEVVQFLKDAQPLAMAEEETIAWFAIRLPTDEYGIFDIFPDGAQTHRRPYSLRINQACAFIAWQFPRYGSA